MDWVSNLFIALLLMNVTGTLFFLIGTFFRKTWFKNDARLLRLVVIATLCAFTVPFVYIFLYMSKRVVEIVEIESDVNLFYNTPVTIRLFTILGVVWIDAFLILLGYRLYRYLEWRNVCKGNIPEDDEMIQGRFLEICDKLGIAGKVALCRNDSIDVPCMTYSHGPVVILPFVKYTKQELDVILYHELCHYLERDMFLKSWGILVALLHGMNPIAHILLKQMDLICEECCDRMVCEKAAEDYTEREYFGTILEMLLTEGRRERYQLLALVDTESNYERRVKFMSEYRKYGCVKKGAALVLSACFLLGSSMTALAAGNGLTDAYKEIAQETSDRVYDLSTDDADLQAMEEICRAYDLDPAKVVMIGDDSIEPYGMSLNVVWHVPADTTYMTSGFTESEGDQVGISVGADPDDITYQTGIKDPNQIMRYVEGEGVITHTFDIEINGRYYFFVTNLSETEEIYIEATVIK